MAIPAGIGLFIALLGLQNAGIVVANPSTCVDLASFNLLKQSWNDIMPMVVTICTLLAIVIMSHKKVRGAVLIGILGGMGLYDFLGLTVEGFYENLNISFLSPVPAFLTLAVMPFTYNISYGIAFGLISYVVISVFCGDAKKIKGSSWVITGLFIAILLLTH